MWRKSVLFSLLFGVVRRWRSLERLGDNISKLTSTTHDSFAAAEQLNRFGLEGFKHTSVLNRPVGHDEYATRSTHVCADIRYMPFV